MSAFPVAPRSWLLYNVPPLLSLSLALSLSTSLSLHLSRSLSLSTSLSLCQLGLQAFSSITACKPRITAARVCLALHASVDHKYTKCANTHPPTRHLYTHVMRDIYIAADTRDAYTSVHSTHSHAVYTNAMSAHWVYMRRHTSLHTVTVRLRLKFLRFLFTPHVATAANLPED